MDVGVRELKEHLSEYLDRAARGEVIRVTERGRPKAILAPLPGQALLQSGIEAGWIRPGSGEPPRPVQRQRGVRPVSAVLLDDRGE
jgi:prevent-host-death family protein